MTKSFYTEQEKEAALGALARCSGNVSRASRLCGVPRGTLKDWKRHPAYARIREEVLPAIRAEAAEMHTELAERESEISRRALSLLAEKLANDAIEAKDLAHVLKTTDIGSGIHRDKAAMLRGEATSVVEHRPATETVRSLAARFPGMFRESTATEIEPPALERGHGQDTGGSVGLDSHHRHSSP